MKHSRSSYLLGVINWRRFGQRIAREIKKTTLSFRDLANELDGASPATLNRICHGKPCSAEMYLWLCREFSIDPMWAYRNAKP